MPDFVHVKHDLRVYFIGPELFRGRESESLLGYQPGRTEQDLPHRCHGGR